jgi:hypothetical protein
MAGEGGYQENLPTGAAGANTNTQEGDLSEKPVNLRMERKEGPGCLPPLFKD